MSHGIIVGIIVILILNFIIGIQLGLLFEKGRHIKTIKRYLTDFERLSSVIDTVQTDYDDLYKNYLNLLKDEG